MGGGGGGSGGGSTQPRPQQSTGTECCDKQVNALLYIGDAVRGGLSQLDARAQGIYNEIVKIREALEGINLQMGEVKRIGESLDSGLENIRQSLDGVKTAVEDNPATIFIDGSELDQVRKLGG